MEGACFQRKFCIAHLSENGDSKPFLAATPSEVLKICDARETETQRDVERGGGTEKTLVPFGNKFIWNLGNISSFGHIGSFGYRFFKQRFIWA